MVFGVCRRLLHNPHDAEDAFQATFLVLVRKAASVVPREMVANWLYGVAHQTAIRASSANAKRCGRERQVVDMPEPEAVSRDCWDDLQPLLDQELSRLPDKYRVPIVLCDLEGKTRKEAARQLGLPEGTVSSRLARARTMLAKRLARRGLTVTGGSLAAVLAQNAASACVPASVVSSTIKTAALIAASQGAVAGVVSTKVAALTEGVMKAMLISKLKIATAVLLVVALIGVGAGVGTLTQKALAARQPEKPGKDVPKDADPAVPNKTSAAANQPGNGAKPAEPPKEDKDQLQGTWRLVSAETDGLMFGEGRQEVKDTRLVIEKGSFTLFGKLRHSPNVPLEPEDVKYVSAFTLDTKQTPKVIVLAWKDSPWNGKFKKDFTQKGIYALDGDTLRLCLSLPYEDKQLLPTEISANYGSKRCLWTFKRDPASEKGGEKKPQPGLPDDVKAKPQVKPAKSPKEDQDQLQGTWRMVTSEADGLRNGAGRPEVKDNRLVIEKSSFTYYYSATVDDLLRGGRMGYKINWAGRRRIP